MVDKETKTEEKEESKIIMPDKDQEKTDSSIIDSDALATDISKKVAESFKKSNVSEEKEESEEKPEDKPENKKEVKIEAETLKPFNIEDTPQYKAMMKRLEKTEKALEQSKIDKEELKTLRSEQNFTKIGTVLANYESNFINPEDGKPDPKAFDKAFEFFRNTDWTVEDIETVLKVVSPFGSVERKYEAPVSTPQSIIQKAAHNRGVPAFDAAFEDKKEKVNKASNSKVISSGLRLVDSIGIHNEA